MRRKPNTAFVLIFPLLMAGITGGPSWIMTYKMASILSTMVQEGSRR